MAGIGFELKKLFKRTGVLASLRAFGYATVITTGPMLLGIVLLLGLMLICVLGRVSTSDRELLVCMITYVLLASVTVTSFLSMVVTRFTADMLFEERNDCVLPSFWGSSLLMLAAGGVLWGVFLVFSGATFVQGVLLFVLFQELVLVWNAMSYLTAIKDYRNMFRSFFVAIGLALALGFVLVWLGGPPIESLLGAVSVGYGVKAVWDVVLLYRHFPRSDAPAFAFLEWMDKFPALAWIGFFTNIGLFSHLVIMWASEVGVRVKGLFFGAPYHDIPALIAFLTILITTVNFVVSVEVNFYPKYRNYNSLYSDKGTGRDILQAEKEMLAVLKSELFYTSLKQLLFSALAISLGGYLLDLVPLGFNEVMKGYFRTLCVGYGLYAIGNMLMLILLYFIDYKGALRAAAAFAAGSVGFSVISLFFPSVYYGFGFLLAALLFLVLALIRLNYYIKRLPYYILCVQPLVEETAHGPGKRAGGWLEQHFGEERNE